jgi:Na+/melibiose symporter-like transporter
VVSTAIGGLLVEVGQRHGATGRLSALREGLIGSMALVVGPIAGWLAARKIGWTAGAGALIWLAFIPVALWVVREPPLVASDGRRVLANAAAQLRVLRRTPTMWTAAGLLFLAYLAPGFQTPLLYHQQDDLHFTPHDMGRLLLLGAMGAIAGSAAYGWLCRRVPLRVLLIGGILLNAGSTLGYLAYASLASAMAITLVAALLGSIAVLPIYDLAARATPRGSESFGYALLMSVQSLTTLAISDPLGATLYGHFHITFPSLVWINATSTAAVLLFVPFLPRALTAPRDGAPAR